jgi:hypothetical protein
MVTTATKIKAQSVNSTFVDGTRISCPVYVGVSPSMAKAILNSIRAKVSAGSSPVTTPGGLVISTMQTTQEEQALTARLKLDINTLRMLLFSSEQRGLPLDLAMRVQHEVPEIPFISEQQLRDAFEVSIHHYRSYAT